MKSFINYGRLSLIRKLWFYCPFSRKIKNMESGKKGLYSPLKMWSNFCNLYLCYIIDEPIFRSMMYKSFGFLYKKYLIEKYHSRWYCFYIDLWQYFSKLWTRKGISYYIIFCYSVDKIKNRRTASKSIYGFPWWVFPDVYYLLVYIFLQVCYMVVYGSRFIFIYLIFFWMNFFFGFEEHYVDLIIFLLPIAWSKL